MTSIRISLASLAAFGDISSCSGCSDRNGVDSENYEFLGHLSEPSSNGHEIGSVDWVDGFDQETTAAPSSDESDEHDCSNPSIAINRSGKLRDGGSESQLAINIPGSTPKPTRRVSFNLLQNSILQLPSNSAIGKIANARAKRRLSLSTEVDKQLADNRARALLPHGASSDLLDPGFAMTSLYVKRGHIHSLEQQHTLGLSASSDTATDEIGLKIGASVSCIPVRGVLKPFTPSPVHASFYLSELGSMGDQEVLKEEEEEEERKHEESIRRRKERAEREQAELEQENEHKHKHKQKHGKKSKKGSKKKCSKESIVVLPTALPLPRPISVTSKM